MPDQVEKRDTPLTGVGLLFAVLVTAWFVWDAKEGPAPDCVLESDVDSRPAECTINYNTWVDEAFPNQSYVDRFSLDASESALLDACTSFVWARIGTPEDWAQAIEDGGFATVHDRVVDACDQYAKDHGL